MEKEKIILIGNYQLDNQESMNRFCLMLFYGFKNSGFDSEIWLPSPFFGKIVQKQNSLSKWLGYIDKWILFPIILRCRLMFKSERFRNSLFHICDHSNAPYISCFPQERTSITCHDVLAIRGALGFKDSYCASSFSGKILQKWILKNLKKAKILIADSNLTLDQLIELSTEVNLKEKVWKVIHIGFNEEFEVLRGEKANILLQKYGLHNGQPYILHVGSSLPRKNRKLLLLMAKELEGNWKGKICFAGQVLDPELKNLVKTLSLEGQIVSVIRPNHDLLCALYSNAEAFIFPSYSEGFGWPLIEAQACGTPVVASHNQPMVEVGGGAAIHCNPDDAKDFALKFLKLNDIVYRNEIIKAGFENCIRFKQEVMIEKYIELITKRK